MRREAAAQRHHDVLKTRPLAILLGVELRRGSVMQFELASSGRVIKLPTFGALPSLSVNKR